LLRGRAGKKEVSVRKKKDFLNFSGLCRRGEGALQSAGGGLVVAGLEKCLSLSEAIWEERERRKKGWTEGRWETGLLRFVKGLGKRSDAVTLCAVMAGNLEPGEGS